MVACDAILRAAGRPSTFRTGLATMTGPRWYGLSFLLPAFLASQQEPHGHTSEVLPKRFWSRHASRSAGSYSTRRPALIKRGPSPSVRQFSSVFGATPASGAASAVASKGANVLTFLSHVVRAL